MTRTEPHDPPPTEIEQLAHRMLQAKELELAFHLEKLMLKSNWSAAYLIRQIIPVFHKDRITLEPRGIYRLLYYIPDYAAGGHKRTSVRYFIDMMAQHLEGCLHELSGKPRSFGVLVTELTRRGVLTGDLANHLEEFNRVVVVPAKHFTARENLPRSIDKRTFGVRDGTLTFVMMRKLSMQLFDLINASGRTLPSAWKQFDDAWLTWNYRATMKEAMGEPIE